MKIHFIGIGGIGVSALARYYLKKGWKVSGCDLSRSETTDQLKKLGIKIRIGSPSRSCVPIGTEKIIYSPAIQKSSLKIESASWRSKLKIPTLSYPEALGELTKTHYTIAVAGTHGKSTTTAMIGLLLIKAGLNPTVVVGTKLKEFGDSNFHMGGAPDTKYKIQDTRYLVIEADEHFASFLNYQPQIAVLTSIEADHLDYYKNLRNLIKAFKIFVSRVPREGKVVANRDDKNIRKILGNKDSVVWFSLKQREATTLRKILKIPGEHNISNALAAFAVARALGIKDTVSFSALSQYRGSWRRFEVFPAFVKTPADAKALAGRSAGKHIPYTLVSDYGHHPTEIAATLQAARAKWPTKKIWLVFQPHQYQRTFYLWKGFVKTLALIPADKVLIADIYDVAGRENLAIKKKVSAQKLVEAIKRAVPQKRKQSFFAIGPASNARQHLRKNLRGGEVVIVMGAGDIYEHLTLRLTQGRPHLTGQNKKGKINQ